MNTKNKLLLKKSLAIFTIYLVLSLTFFTAKAFAALNYEISGDKKVLGFAKKVNDKILLTTQSDSNVKYNGNDLACIDADVSGIVRCNSGPIVSEQIPLVDGALNFKLTQSTGTPNTIDGVLYVDNTTPVKNIFTVDKVVDGLNFVYDFTDYLVDSGETSCKGSGIGSIILTADSKVVFTQNILTQNCTVSGSYFKNLSNTNNGVIYYKLEVTDRVGNKYSTGLLNISGDFAAPKIANTFKIVKDTIELKQFSALAKITADVYVSIEDSNLDVNNVYADLSNLNPLLKLVYTDVKATQCTTDTIGKEYICVFRNIEIMPASTDLTINVRASDHNLNSISKTTLPNKISLVINAGTVSYIGPLKTHCTKDLTTCYLKSGRQLLNVELDATSSYNRSLINIGVNSETRFAICNLNTTWKCVGVYDVPATVTSLNLFLAESYDDYGNSLDTDMDRMVLIDDVKPKNITVLNVTNSKNNIGCSAAGDELEFNVRISEATAEPEIHVDTSKFTSNSKKIQIGECLPNGDNIFDCSIIVKDFITDVTSVNESIIIEDLAGNKLSLPYQFNICKATTATTPNVIFGISQQSTPKIDRKTASLIPIKTYIPISLIVKPGSTIMYASIDRCTGLDINNMEAITSNSYFIPNSGSSLTLVTSIGGKGKLLPEDSLTFNCTISARIKQGSTIFILPEKEVITLTINTFNQPLGTLDAATLQEIKTQKETLRNIDKDIKKRQDVDNILKRICDISSIIVKVDGVLQVVKSVIYVVAVAIEWTGAGEPLWKAVEPPISSFDKFVQTFVWPTGTDPASVIGYVWKYTCFIYNCKFYTLSGLIELGSDAVNGAKAIKENNKIKQDKIAAVKPKEANPEDMPSQFKDTPATPTPVTDSNYNGGTDEDPNGFNSPGNDIVNEDNPELLPEVVIVAKDKSITPPALAPIPTPKLTGKDVKLPFLNVKTGIVRTVGSSVDYSYKGKVLDNNNLGQFQTDLAQSAFVNDQRQSILYQDIDRQDWIINPYRSKHYDGLCAPATLYNLQKERQIRCMYLSCLQTSQTTGLSSRVCKDTYKFNDCLYLESAQYKLNNNVWSQITKGIITQAVSAAMGFALQATFNSVCERYNHNLQQPTLVTGWYNVWCGLFSGVLKFQEIKKLLTTPGQVMSDLFNGNIPKDPASIQDYCNGGDLYAK